MRKSEKREIVEEICLLVFFLSCLYEVFLLENLDFLCGCDMVEFDCLVGEKSTRK